MSLSDRLRAAALERAQAAGQHVDGVVLEPNGVIDLREMARDAARDVDNSVRLPRLGDRVAEPSDDRPLTDTSLWRRLRPLPGTTPEPVIDLREEPTINVTDSLDDGPTPIADLPPLWEPTIADPEPHDTPEAVVIDLDADVTSPCDRCGSTGRRDLFDRFSRTQYFSCDDCGHMWQERLDS